MLDEARHDIVRVVRVADCIGTTEQHLETNVRHLFPQAAEAFPWTFVEETHRSVEGRAAPHFQRKKLWRAVGDGLGNPQHVEAAHPGGDE